jgi:hypothetical protein
MSRKRRRARKRRSLVAETAYYKVWSDGEIELDCISMRAFPHELDALVAVAQYVKDLTDDETEALWEVQRWVGGGEDEKLPDPSTVKVMRQGMIRLAVQHGPAFVKAWHIAMVDGLGSFNVMLATAPGELLELLRQKQAKEQS